MLIIKMILAFMGICFGTVISGGVFSVLVAVGLIPRFAGKTETARYVMRYEDSVILGTIIGCFTSVFDFAYGIGEMLHRMGFLGEIVAKGFCGIYGIFTGIFVGCLALTIAEMLNSIPIFSRRVGLRHGLGICVLAFLLGKITGSFLYFAQSFFETAP